MGEDNKWDEQTKKNKKNFRLVYSIDTSIIRDGSEQRNHNNQSPLCALRVTAVMLHLWAST